MGSDKSLDQRRDDGLSWPESENYLSQAELSQRLLACRSQLQDIGIQSAEITGEPECDTAGHAFFIPVSVISDDGHEVRRFIVLDFIDRNIVYRFHDTAIILATVTLPQHKQSLDLLEMSRTTKVVKSRPAFMYPELFQLTSEEVWPKGADIAVIGDPDAAIDRDRVTIVEYEYALEIFPPILQERLNDQAEAEVEYYDQWYSQLFHEDLRALDNLYGPYTPENNPYSLTAITAIHRLGDLYRLGANNLQDHERLAYFKSVIEDVRLILRRLADSTWNLDEFTDLDSAVRMEDDEDLRQFFSYKQFVLEKNGQPEAWKEFIQRWTGYLEVLPHDHLNQNLANYSDKLQRAKHWLSVLPTAKSPERVTLGLRYLENFYAEIREHPTPGVSAYLDPARSPEIEDALATGFMSDGAFGFFIPGQPISFRTRKFLSKLDQMLENTLDYLDNVLPQLEAERARLLDLGIPASPAALFAWLRPLEQRLIRERYFIKPTEKAVALHGFFPYAVSLDPQDRILALTSVTMHGWNALDEKGFRLDLEASLPYLKLHGKYILGPINQRVYFGGYDQGFDADGLTRALQSLQAEGRIKYHFVKGNKLQSENVFGDALTAENSNDVVQEADNTVLLIGESAHSLVIERLA